MIRSLQSLRSIFAIILFLRHSALLSQGGDMVVCFFLILSGFLSANSLNAKNITSGDKYARYIERRALRIYPLHWLCLLAAIVLGLTDFTDTSIRHAIANALLLQSWLPWTEYCLSGNSVSWFLSSLLFCYAVAPVIMFILRRSTALFYALLCSTIALYFVILPHIPGYLAYPLIYFNPALRVIDFAIGMAIWHIYAHCSSWQPGNLATRNAVEFGVVAVVIAAAYYVNDAAHIYVYASYWWVPMALTVFVFAMHDKAGGVITAILHNRLTVAAATYTFSFYMVHKMVINSLHDLMPEVGPIVAAITAFVCSCALAWCAHTFVEKPVGSHRA